MDEERKLMTIDEVEAYLSEVADTFPQEFFDQLNGGIVLTRRLVPSPQEAGLFILGTYHNEPYGMGRYIALNYGSFTRLYRGRPREEQRRALRELLRHELTHHVESLAGVRDLEIKDEQFIEKYRKNKQKKKKGYDND